MAKGTLNNLTLTTTRGLLASGGAAALNLIYSSVANGGRDQKCKFYYSMEYGGSLIQVVARKLVGGAVPQLKDMAVNGFNSLINGSAKKSGSNKAGNDQSEPETVPISDEENYERNNYGTITTENGKEIFAVDECGEKSRDALMMAIDTGSDITMEQEYKEYVKGVGSKNTVVNKVTSKTLVWYDTTALVTVNSDKNIITTQVQGRDYSRKELVSNGDIKFSVRGQMTSGKPDIYPAAEVKKFLKMMQYKGIIRINNEILDQFGVNRIIITGYGLSPREGYKAVQEYSFTALGLQPEKEIEITSDTVKLAPKAQGTQTEAESSAWLNMLDGIKDGLKAAASDVVDLATTQSGVNAITRAFDEVF